MRHAHCTSNVLSSPVHGFINLSQCQPGHYLYWEIILYSTLLLTTTKRLSVFIFFCFCKNTHEYGVEPLEISPDDVTQRASWVCMTHTHPWQIIIYNYNGYIFIIIRINCYNWFALISYFFPSVAAMEEMYIYFHCLRSSPYKPELSFFLFLHMVIVFW